MAMLLALLVPSIFMSMFYLSIAVSLPAAPLYVVLMMSIHASAPAEKKIWSQLGVAFTVIFATLMSINYYVQVTAVRQLGVHEGPLFLFTMSGVPLAVDTLCWVFLALGLLSIVPIFTGGRLERSIQWVIIAYAVLCLINMIGHVLANQVLLLAMLAPMNMLLVVSVVQLSIFFWHARRRLS